ncbi:hypothetical protein ACIQNU_06415 [Streptomyces sp. NPDC091292]|uniref:hypothetical protein n=1 Tax=Streptomyces sp. NPDC091292 TaxID=3365991 RepID=UPI003812AE4F
MGWTVLYIAFGIVALWLLGEVLLQYKARLRYRALAFCGFLGVVLGVLIPSVPVIALGAIAFAVGQTYVTLSFRRGFSTGWAIGGRPGGSKRRRTGSGGRQEPTLQVSDLESADDPYPPDAQHPDAPHHDNGAYAADTAYADDDVFRNDRDPAYASGAAHPGTAAYAYDQSGAGPATTIYEPEPLPDDTGQYGIYSDTAYAAASTHGRPDTPDYPQNQGTPDYGYDSYAGYDQQQPAYNQDPHQYAAYSDPYTGTQSYDGQGYDPYAQQAYPQDPYAPHGYGETPPGGVWVPQQRGVDGQPGQPGEYGGELPPEQPQPQPYPYQNGGYPAADPGAGYDGQQQYRY